MNWGQEGSVGAIISTAGAHAVNDPRDTVSWMDRNELTIIGIALSRTDQNAFYAPSSPAPQPILQSSLHASSKSVQIQPIQLDGRNDKRVEFSKRVGSCYIN